jgi:hypothetical protein
MAQYEHLPIYKAAFDLQIYFEGIVRNFSRYHKYTHGAALRDFLSAPKGRTMLAQGIALGNYATLYH